MLRSEPDEKWHIIPLVHTYDKAKHALVVAAKVVNTLYVHLLSSCDERKDNLQEQLTRLVQFHENMISALTWLTSAESKIAELDSAVDAAEEHPDLTSLKEELKVWAG